MSPSRHSHRLALACLTLFLLMQTVGCVTTTDQLIMMSEQQGSGRPDRVLEIFSKYNEDGFEKANKQVLRMACISHLSMHDFDTHAECNAIVKDKKVFPPWGDLGGESIYHANEAMRAELLGDDDAVLHHVAMSLGDDGDSIFPVTAWQMAASAHARRGELERSREYIGQIDEWRLRLFWVVQMMESSMSVMRRNAMARVYLEMGDYEGAATAFSQNLKGKHYSEYVFDLVMAAGGVASGDSVSAIAGAAENALMLVINAVNANSDEEKPDPYFMMRLDNLFLSGLVAARTGQTAQARMVFEAVLALRHVELQKNYYFDALWELGKIYQLEGRHEEAEALFVRAIAEVEGTLALIGPAEQKAGYLRRRAAVYGDLAGLYVALGRDGDAQGYCRRGMRWASDPIEGCPNLISSTRR